MIENQFPDPENVDESQAHHENLRMAKGLPVRLEGNHHRHVPVHLLALDGPLKPHIRQQLRDHIMAHVDAVHAMKQEGYESPIRRMGNSIVEQQQMSLPRLNAPSMHPSS